MSFINEPVIKYMATQKRWAISDPRKKENYNDPYLQEKAPMNVNMLMCNMVKYVNPSVPDSMVSLDVAYNFAPNCGRYAYYLDTMLDNLIIIDIEKTCPPELLVEFLKLPYIYAETSMSGKGVHLIMAKPSNFHDIEQSQKTVIKDPRGYYEILQNHWCTFTGNPLPQNNGSFVRITPPTLSWDDVYKEIALASPMSAVGDITTEIADIKDVPQANELMEMTKIFVLEDEQYLKALDNTDGSAREFSIISTIKRSLDITNAILNVPLSTEEEIAVIFELASDHDIIEYRPKHETVRQGMLWLHYTVINVLAKS